MTRTRRIWKVVDPNTPSGTQNGGRSESTPTRTQPIASLRNSMRYRFATQRARLTTLRHQTLAISRCPLINGRHMAVTMHWDGTMTSGRNTTTTTRTRQRTQILKSESTREATTGSVATHGCNETTTRAIPGQTLQTSGIQIGRSTVTLVASCGIPKPVKRSASADTRCRITSPKKLDPVTITANRLKEE